MTETSTDNSSWAIGGCTLIGVGVGLALLQTNVLWMVASLLIGLGVGLLISSLMRQA